MLRQYLFVLLAIVTAVRSLEPPRQLDNYDALIQDVFQIPSIEGTSPPAPPPVQYPHSSPQPQPPQPQPQPTQSTYNSNHINPPPDVHNKHESNSNNPLNYPNVRCNATRMPIETCNCYVSLLHFSLYFSHANMVVSVPRTTYVSMVRSLQRAKEF